MDLGRDADRVRFILADPSITANIGSAARAVKTMGFGKLWVTNPRVPGYRKDPDAVRLSTQAADVLEGSRSCGTLAEALKGVRFAWALSGYDHEYGPPIMPLREAAEESASLLRSEPEAVPGESDIAFVFGTERDGLSNAEVLLCQGIAAIPADSGMPSLNLAQAVQVCAYEMREALRQGGALLPWEVRFGHGVPASAEAMNGLSAHLEEALTRIGMTRPGDPRRMTARLRTILDRATPTDDEVVLLRAVCAAILKPRTAWQKKETEDRRPAKAEKGWKAGRAE
ncbi:MAG: RNA methyltransferase [Sutterellaceae bacterium]|nr:RNA methyltransferase [Sutterellaceae bacterium]MDD7441912.1 TrmH family RNA methyltransferase [Sutterellaceae bacterium]MDY2867438.1 TrmH family RNA methyltransferase [Mesosutterella sp.]